MAAGAATSPPAPPALPGSSWQADEQPSPLHRLPSSQISPAVMMPLPHPVSVQLLSQPSPSSTLPSSQTSPVVATPLPHSVTLQLLSQPSPLIVLPSSHSSPAFGIHLDSPHLVRP